MNTDPNSMQWEYFDRFTPNYDPERTHFILEDFRHRNNVNSVLDVGCGDGATLKYLGDRFKGLSLHGVDPSRSYIERARSVSEISSATVGSILDGLPEELQECRYDAVIMASVLHHLVGTTRKDS